MLILVKYSQNWLSFLCEVIQTDVQPMTHDANWGPVGVKMSFPSLLVDELTKADPSDLVGILECATQVPLKGCCVKWGFEFYDSDIFDDYLNLKIWCNIAINCDEFQIDFVSVFDCCGRKKNFTQPLSLWLFHHQRGSDELQLSEFIFILKVLKNLNLVPIGFR